MKRFAALIIFFLSIPFTTLAVDGTFIIPSWTDPTPSRNYLFSDPVVINGSWQLPPDWAGNIYVYMDAPLDGFGNPIAEGTQKTDLNTGLGYYAISNAGGVASSSGAFSINLGTQPDGAHNVYLKFVGGEQCAVNKQVNAQTGSTFMPECSITAQNLIYVVWQPRDFVVGLPPYPRMVVTPTTTPALNYANVVFGSSLSQSFTIQNTGAQTLTGSVSGLSAPFSCGASCGYTINPGSSAIITIIYTPQVISDTQNININFSCIGSSYGCDGQPYIVTSQQRNVIANSVANVVAPQITVTPGSINFGNVYLGVPVPGGDRTMTVRNVGGGILNGVVTFSTSEYTCTGNPSCSYSILAGSTGYIYIRYTPTIVGPHSDTASFTGGGGVVVPMQSLVGDLPVINIYNTATATGTPLNFGTVNVGSCATRDTYIRNVGAGLLSGDAMISPAGTLAGLTCIIGCNYVNYTNAASWQLVRFQFCPTGAGPVSEVARFSNLLNSTARGEVTINANGNILPVGVISGIGSFSFGNTLIGAVSPTRSITIQNTGVGNLSGSVGVLPTGYTCASGCAYNIPPLGTQVITLAFTPLLVQSYNGSVTLSCSTCASGIVGTGPVGITGAGVKPDFQMSYSGSPLTTCPGTTCVTELPQTFPRGDYDVGATTFGGALAVQYKTFYLYVMNKGSGANAAYSLPSTPHFVCLSNCSGSLGAGVSRTAMFEFRPDAATTFTEPLLVTYDYGLGPQTVTLNLTGSSVASPYLSLVPNANIPLGNVSVGNTATATFTVTNLGTGFLNGTVSIPAAGVTPVSPVSLAGHWTFDDVNMDWNGHRAFDISGNNNTAYLPGPIAVAGPTTPVNLNEALDMNGLGGITDAGVTGILPGNTPHTMSAWIKLNALGPARQWIALLGNEGNGSLHWLVQSSGITQFGVYGGAQTAPVLPLGTWVHVVTTYDGTTLRSYINGTLNQSVTASFNLLGNPPPLTVGIQHLNESNFNGQIDDLRIYKRALTGTEVSNLYTSTFSSTLDIAMRWSFDDPTVTWSALTVADVSGKGNNGTLTPVPVAVPGKIAEGLSYNATQYEEAKVRSTMSVSNVNSTIATWVYLNSTLLNGAFIKVGNSTTGFGIGVGSGTLDSVGNNLIGLFEYVRWIPTGVPIGTGWHHVAMVLSGSGLPSLYLDGVLVGTYAGSNSSIPSGAETYVGGYRGNSGENRHVKAILDDTRIYRRALSSGEISDLYNGGVAAGGGAFTCVSGCVISNLPFNSAQQVLIEFTPTVAQSYISYPEFLSNGGNYAYPTAPYPSITGTGVLDPVIAVTPASIVFPDTNQGLSSQFTITIENTGAGNLSGSISPVKSPGLNFYCLSGCNYNIPAGGSATAVIEFAPQSVATLSGTITLNSNAINGQQTIAVSGRGILAPIIALSAADTNYGSVIVGKYKDLSFTIENAGTASLGSGYFDVTGEFACVNPVSVIDGLCHYNIGPGGSVTITVRFSPTSIGPKSGSVSLSGVPLARFFVNGVGVAPTVKFIEQ